ncbi:hypothetical protein [Spongiactinospora sp. TRM90649]|uniref:hypothetical protein n=1 Tax=Spongiactinospora sp. TRM90649 TaxID=3031114 RepID=UPI0023F6441A|nr:hypothetical protein [Spongiactinospora sp. TRM90649]MDF5752958.1 hypothetical protein [Spongiactinospora sp. TRM90649]
MCWEAAYAVQLKQAIDAARKNQDEVTLASVAALFAVKDANLKKARRLLEQVLIDHDRKGMWSDLDKRAARLDIEDVSERWARGLVEHPFPIALRSLRFNWTYMKEHGVRAFYEMTTRYVDHLSDNTARWLGAWEQEISSGIVDRVTTGGMRSRLRRSADALQRMQEDHCRSALPRRVAAGCTNGPGVDLEPPGCGAARGGTGLQAACPAPLETSKESLSHLVCTGAVMSVP